MSVREAYLDNAATTRAFDSVTDVMVKVLASDYGNPSSMHTKGMEAERFVKQAREEIATALKCEPRQIVFTSGGTESNNTAIGTAVRTLRHEGRHIVTTPFEHDSVSEPMKALEKEGYEVTRVPVDACGIVDLQALREALRPDTVLVSVMYVNNEIGAVQPVAEIAKLVHELAPKAMFHVDAIQAFGKYAIRPKKEGIDLLSASGHKIHGPKGVGFLYVADPVRFKPLILGGGQQNGMRSGTENVPGIAGLAEAVRVMNAEGEACTERMRKIRDRFAQGVRLIEGAQVNGPLARVLALRDDGADEDTLRQAEAQAAPHIVSVSFEGVRAEVLLHALEERGVYCSSGSACSTNHTARTHSRTLLAVGLRKDLLESTLRFSFGAFSAEEDAEYAAEQLAELVPFLRKFRRN